MVANSKKYETVFVIRFFFIRLGYSTFNITTNKRKKKIKVPKENVYLAIRQYNYDIICTPYLTKLRHIFKN